jgi:uncharacterized protein DUF3108
MLSPMSLLGFTPSRLRSRGRAPRVLACGRAVVAALGVLGALGASACGQAGLVEPEVPARASRLLAPASRPAKSEVLRASVEAFGLEIATLESSSCSTPGGGATIETEVDAAPLVRVIRRTSGEAKTELTSAGSAPTTSDYTFRDGDVVRHYQVDYRTGGYAYVYDNGGVQRRTGVNEVPDGAEPHDMHSSLLLLRAWRPRLEEKAYFYVVLGRRPWRVDVTSRGPEMIKLGEDPRLTNRIEGVAVRLGEGPEPATSKRFTLWLSEDADRVPLRMVADASFGSVTMTLTARDAARRECQTPAVADTRAPEPGAVSAGVGLIGSAWTTPPRRP